MGKFDLHIDWDALEYVGRVMEAGGEVGGADTRLVNGLRYRTTGVVSIQIQKYEEWKSHDKCEYAH